MNEKMILVAPLSGVQIPIKNDILELATQNHNYCDLATTNSNAVSRKKQNEPNFIPYKIKINKKFHNFTTYQSFLYSCKDCRLDTFNCLVIYGDIQLKENVNSVDIEENYNNAIKEIVKDLFGKEDCVRWVNRTLISNDNKRIPKNWIPKISKNSESISNALDCEKAIFGWGNNLINTTKEIDEQIFKGLIESLIETQWLWIALENIYDTTSSLVLNDDRKNERKKTIEKENIAILEKLAVLQYYHDQYKINTQGIKRILIDEILCSWGYNEMLHSVSDRIDLTEKILNRWQQKRDSHFQNLIEIILTSMGILTLLSLFLDMLSAAFSGEVSSAPHGIIMNFLRITNIDAWITSIITTVLIFLCYMVYKNFKR